MQLFRSITLPYQGAPVGLSESDRELKPVQRKTQELTRFDPILPENATSGWILLDLYYCCAAF